MHPPIDRGRFTRVVKFVGIANHCTANELFSTHCTLVYTSLENHPRSNKLPCMDTLMKKHQYYIPKNEGAGRTSLIVPWRMKMFISYIVVVVVFTAFVFLYVDESHHCLPSGIALVNSALGNNKHLASHHCLPPGIALVNSALGNNKHLASCYDGSRCSVLYSL